MLSKTKLLVSNVKSNHPSDARILKPWKKIVLYFSTALLFIVILHKFLPVEFTFLKNYERALITTAVFLITIILLSILHYFIFDPDEETSNPDKISLVRKLRLRALLLNNISVLIIAFVFCLITSGFYFLINYPKYIISPNPKVSFDKEYYFLILQIAYSGLLLILIQILFKVFRYILRVAAFYNAKADAIEFHDMDGSLPLDKLMDLFTPTAYEISEIDKPGINFSSLNQSNVPGLVLGNNGLTTTPSPSAYPSLSNYPRPAVPVTIPQS